MRATETLPVKHSHWLEHGIIGVHLGLVAAVCATLAVLQFTLLIRITIMLIAILPLLATLPALLARRRAVLPWLALSMVGYAGLGTVEVMATSTLAASLLLLFALLELALTLTLRRLPEQR